MAHEPTRDIGQCAAVVLAGGYSTRFGDSDKAITELDGKPLVRHVVERIAPAVSEVIINCRDEQREAIERALSGIQYRLAIDPVSDRGPVAGIRTGCRVASSAWILVTACDMPFIDSRLPCRLFDAVDVDEPAGAVETNARIHEIDGVVPQVDRRLQPLAAVYRSTAIDEAADAVLEEDSGSITDVLNRLSIVRVPELVSAHAVTDIDTRAELRAARARLH
jgi:molybdopterin-guanine dinucleotide biosynthesis protein A